MSSAARCARVTATYAVAVVRSRCAVGCAGSCSVCARCARGGIYSLGLFAPSGAHLPFAGSAQAVCGRPGVGVGQCLIDVLQPSGAAPDAASPTGLSPSTIEGAYGYTSASTAGSGQTIALVDAYDDPDAASDLNEFSAQYGLPPECTGESSPPSCFEFDKVSQTGGSTLPPSNSDWDLETSLDIEWAHALAPAANILLVEATSNNTPDLLAAEQYAADNAKYVSNSWGATEFAGETSVDSYFTQPRCQLFRAAGDKGGVVDWPSSSPDVISVGGPASRSHPGVSLLGGGLERRRRRLQQLRDRSTPTSRPEA